ncbi:methyltransferase small protein [Halorhabdus tiamatea SARL4B]|uniref:Methyltransferase small protein n=1 Tax=Halorhabdus tiamatea SARL4B TaxID=1033806 RepID=F7PIN6_9EURY|nr:METTL5 family protein [Halorhabdus tiamatea]ERJ06996.1 methyltransferase small protein [Halorhabdus tiamatea SARL4B]CCQ34768.1 RNA methylase-like protein [Halorhabdus tiamatea SARL4B]
MSTKRQLAQRLGVLTGFDEPDASLEQYRTPPAVAAYLVHLADLNGDVAGRTVVDLGCGTGMLALGAALRDPARVVGVDIDPKPLSTARANQDRIGTETAVAWLRADATDPPLCLAEPVTVLMNPPFGAQSGNEHADRRFLGAAAEISTVSYSIHNAGSADFVESFAADNGGEVTAAYRSTLSVPRQFAFHDDDERDIDIELFRIEW